MEQIPYNEVSFHPHSFFDPIGRLFWWDGQLYREISSEWAPFFTKLYREGVIQRLVDQGLLIETKPTSLTIEGYEMVVCHRQIPFASYPNEWCAAMFKNAALTIIDLAIELAQHGLTLRDGHPWNILFDAYKPVFVDLGSIIPINDSVWPGYDEFCRFCLYPLILMSHGQDQIARLLLYEAVSVQKSDILMLTRSFPPVSIQSVMSHVTSVFRQRLPKPYRKLLKRGLRPIQSLFCKQSRGPKSQLDFLKKIRQEVECINLPSYKTKCLDYDKNSIPSLTFQDTWTAKQRGLHKILTELRPSSVLDIGSNTGWYSKLAALLGSRVVSFDIDAMCITELYYDTRDDKLPILPLIMDFIKPTPSRGPFNHWSIAATDRFQCDMVLALGLVHNVAQRLYFDQIVEGLALFSNRWLVVEFIPHKDEYSHKRWWSAYTLDNFINTLRRRFHSISIMPSYPEPRVLLLCEK